jgi:lipopolysaccharide transport system permease protein
LSVITEINEKIALERMPLVVIQPTKGWVPLQINELWAYRELLFFLMWRDIKVRYNQTIIGVSWAVIQPFMTMIVFSLFFGRLAKIPSNGIPYPIFSFAALVPWTFFAAGLQQCATSVTSSANLIKKIYFPRLIIPFSALLSVAVDTFLAFLTLLGMMLYYGITPTYNVLWLPFFALLLVIASLGVGLWLAAMQVQFRDVRQIVPFLIQFWMFATPIAYPSNLITNETLRTIYGINPMVGVVEGFRWALLGTETAPGPIIIVSTIVSTIILISGLYYFRRTERTFADLI